MTSTNNTLNDITIEIANSIAPLANAFSSFDKFKLLLKSLGWNSDVFVIFPTEIINIFQSTLTLTTKLTELNQKLEDDEPLSINQIRDLFNVVKQVINGINEVKNIPNLPNELIESNFLQLFPRQLLDYLLSNYLLQHQPKIGHLLAVLGLIRNQFEKGTNNRINHFSYKFAFEDLSQLVDNPQILFQNAYGWNTDDFDTSFFFTHLENLFMAYGANLSYNTVNRNSLRVFNIPNPDEVILPRILQAALFDFAENNSRIRAGLGLFKLVKQSTSKPGLTLLPFIDGNFREQIEIFDKFFIKVETSLSLQGGVGIVWLPNEDLKIIVGFDTPEPITQVTGVLKLIVANEDTSGQPILLLGSRTSSYVEYKSLSLSGGIAINAQNQPVLFIETELEKAKIVISAGEGDGFLQKIFSSNKIESNFDIVIGFSTLQSLYFRGSAGLEIAIPTHISIGVLELNRLIFSIGLSMNKIPINIGSNIQVKLGPLQVVVENMGLYGNFEVKDNNSGNLGLFDISLGFKPPNGVGLSIDAAVVKGGGYLFFDFDREEYAGVLQISISGIVTITAIGMITTKMPDGSKGFSLLIIMSMEFMPGIQLGFGFTIAGIGGLIGLNRTMRLEALAQGVRTGTINNIMFPQGDIIANAPRIISDLRAIFPPEEGKFLIGPMIKLGWGTPTLISVSLGVIIEIPGNIAIIGVLRVVLPDKEAPILVLQIAFVGAIEFDKKRLWFFASMFESRILFMTIEGEMGLLVGWGDDANFVISVGGFNPRFNPPPLPFPTPRRIAVDMTISPVQRIRIEGYFAVTSNTVQFGARAEMVLGLDDFGIQGHIQFDALFQFSPFHFVIDISASFSLKAFGVGVFSIRLEFQLEGPTPWRAKGRGSISLFFFDISADFDITWGDSQDTTLPFKPVIKELVDELNKVENWKAELPAANNLFVALRKLDEKTETLILHPLGNLRISQRLIPLDIKIDKVGNQKPEDANKFVLEEASDDLERKDFSLEPFALAQFQNMDDATKLTLPAFEKQHSGLVLSASGNAFKTSRVVSRIVRYEEIIIDNNYKRFATKFKSFMGLLFRHFLNGNAVSKLTVSQAYQSKVNPFEDKIIAGGDKYAVAHNDTNKPFNNNKVYFDSHALAEEYMRTEISKQPNLVETLHVIPDFETVGV
jgi:hypothetical protein